jgi:hypothetical protein
MVAGGDLVSAVGRGKPGHRQVGGSTDTGTDNWAVEPTPSPDPYILVPARVTNMWRFRHVKNGPQNRISIDVSGMRRHAGPTVP